MNTINLICSFVILAVASVNAGGLPLASVYAASPLLARSYVSSPLLAPEVLTASAPAFTRAIAAPVVARAAPLLAPTVQYAQYVPQNIPPFSSQVNIVNRALSGYVAAPLAARYVASAVTPLVRAPLAYSSAPVLASAAAPLAASYVAPGVAPFLRTPLAYSTAPLLPSLPIVRSSPFAVPVASPLAAAAAAVPLHTQAIYRTALAPAVAPVGVAPLGVATRVSPLAPAPVVPVAPALEGALEVAPVGDEEASVVAARTPALEPVQNSEGPTENLAPIADDADASANAEQTVPESATN